MKCPAFWPLAIAALNVAAINKRPRLDQAMISRAEAEADIAAEARKQAAADAKEVEANLKLKQMDQDLWDAEDATAASEQALSNAKKQKEVSEKNKTNAQNLASLANEENLKAARNGAEIARKAAEKAVEETMAAIKQEAKDAVEKAKKQKADFLANSSQHVASAVASAIQPYHLAMLRAQKAVAETHQKAVACMETAQRMVHEAHQFAAEGQSFQTAGLWVEANSMMMQAHAAMNGAVTLKKQAEDLQNLAISINSSIGSYALNMSMAATNAEATASVDIPKVMPAINDFIDHLR